MLLARATSYQVTGTVKVDDVAWLDAIRRLHLQRSEKGLGLTGMFSSVGDLEARIVWRYADGSQLGVRLPHWRACGFGRRRK